MTEDAVDGTPRQAELRKVATRQEPVSTLEPFRPRRHSEDLGSDAANAFADSTGEA